MSNRKMVFKSLRFKILFSAALTVFIVQGSLYTYQIISNRTMMLQEFKKTQNEIVSELSSSLIDPLWNYNFENVHNLISLKFRNAAFTEIQIYGINPKKLIIGLKNTPHGIDTLPDILIKNRQSVSNLIPYKDKDRWQIFYHFSDEAIRNKIKQSIVFSLLSATLGSIALIALLFIIVTKLIIKPLVIIIARLQDIAQGSGDLSKRLTITGKNREMDELSQWFNAFVDKISALIKQNKESVKKLTDSLKEHSELSSHIFTSSREMYSHSEKIASSSEDAAKNLTTISTDCERMNSTVNQTTSSVEGISSTISEITNNCQEESRIANDASGKARTSKEHIKKLEKAANEIGNILDMIKDIADQTNLLALNATIEAASAGDAGKGFAVVANEVKELAKQTTEATGLIGTQVHEIKTSTQYSVKSIEDISTVVEEVNRISQFIVNSVEHQSNTITEIASVFNNVNGVSANISNQVTTSAEGLEHISSNIIGFNKEIDEISKTIAKAEENTRNLSGIANTIKSHIDQFII